MMVSFQIFENSMYEPWMNLRPVPVKPNLWHFAPMPRANSDSTDFKATNAEAMIAPVSAAYARALLRHFGKTADQRGQLLRGTTIEESSLSQPSAGLPAAALVALAANITRRHGELWALGAETVWSNSMQGALDVAVRTASTVGDALATGARFGSVRAPFVRARLREATGTVRLEISPAFTMDQSVWRAIALAVGLNIHGLFAQILDDSMGDARLEFPWPPPAGSQRLRAFFSCQLKFKARAFAFEVPRQLCGLPSPFADPGLHAKALEALQMTGRGDGASLRRTVESLIAMHLPNRLSEENAARLLGLARRTFVRRLAVSGVGFRGLLDGVLRERASAMSAAGRMSREEMAAVLGYADATSLSRACRRWFGSKR
jgi:AraC-like DNA-binding protein